MNLNVTVLTLTLLTAISGCSNYTPKPHGYPKIEFPNRSYELYDNDCVYTFEKPTYSVVEVDSHEWSEPCWYNIKFPTFGATVYLSYKKFTSLKQLDSLTEEAFKLAGKHNIKADAINEREFVTEDSTMYGLTFELTGPSATPFNFYLTDEKEHFLRGSFYFDNQTKTDSVAPVYEFLKQDVMHLIETVRW